MTNVLAIPPGTPYVKALRPITDLEGTFSGEILVIGSGPSCWDNIDAINGTHLPKMYCSGGHGPENLVPVEFLWFSDSFWARKRLPVKPESYLFTRGVIADPRNQFIHCAKRWYHWCDEVPMEMYTGPCAVRGALYLGFEKAHFVGIDGGKDPRTGIDYYSSKLQMEELKERYPGVVVPWRPQQETA